MKKLPALILISILFIVFQQAMFARIDFLNIAFDVTFVYIICFALTRNEAENIIIALITGVIRDAFFPALFGIHTVVYIIVAYLCIAIQRRIYKNTLLVPIVIVFLFTIVKGLITYLFLFVSLYKFSFIQVFVDHILVESVCNGIITPFIYLFINKINSMKYFKEEWKF